MKRLVGQRAVREDVNTILWVNIVHEDGSEEALAPRTDLWNHSSTDFECGYGGSGPAQLSLAICAWLLDDDDMALQYHQEFKHKYVARFPRRGFDFTEEKLRGWLEKTIGGVGNG